MTRSTITFPPRGPIAAQVDTHGLSRPCEKNSEDGEWYFAPSPSFDKKNNSAVTFDPRRQDHQKAESTRRSVRDSEAGIGPLVSPPRGPGSHPTIRLRGRPSTVARARSG